MITGSEGFSNNGKTTKGSLPNIVGSFYIAKAGYYDNGSTTSGAFFMAKSGYGNNATVKDNTGTIIYFDANTINGLYANDNPGYIIPKAIYVTHIIKY